MAQYIDLGLSPTQFFELEKKGQALLVFDIENLLIRAKAGDFTPTGAKDKKPIFALREELSDMAARAIYGKYNP